jgi:hypothetical protein
MDSQVPELTKREEIELKAKYDFLSVMYKAMWDNINRHVTVLWQAVGVLATAFGASLLVKGESATGSTGLVVDMAATVVIAAAFWLIAHAMDAANWYNRNIQIIGNIERVFFAFMKGPERVHPYGAPTWQRENKILLHMRIQLSLGAMVAAAAFLLHLFARVLPDMKQDNAFDPPRILPLVAAVIGVITCVRVRKETRNDFDKFLTDLQTFQAETSD